MRTRNAVTGTLIGPRATRAADTTRRSNMCLDGGTGGGWAEGQWGGYGANHEYHWHLWFNRRLVDSEIIIIFSRMNMATNFSNQS
jgi:hypothetical protein